MLLACAVAQLSQKPFMIVEFSFVSSMLQTRHLSIVQFGEMIIKIKRLIDIVNLTNDLYTS